MASALLTDFYELTMVDAYLSEALHDEAAFSLFVRRLPARRNYLLACGLEEVLTYLETLRFSPGELSWLESLERFSPRLLDWLEHFRFTGDVYAVPEGTPVFGEEPLLEVIAPLPEAQLVETYLINQMHLQTLAASKAARVVEAAGGRPVVDFGVRRMHGEDAGLKVARAAYVAGVGATSNLQAGQRYGIPVAGTMAHSYIQAHDDELAAFRAYVHRFPETTLLVDTYDTLEGVRKVVALARELGPDFQVRAVRLDSGDLVSLAHSARWLLDAAGLERVRIFASGGLDEDEVARLLAHHAPIDAFGVGTAMGVSADVPALDMAYKLVEYAGRGRLKLSPGKVLLPGRKQVFREEEDGLARRDVLARHGEELPGRPLLRQVMHAGRRLEGASPSLEAIRALAREELERLPLEVRRLEPVRPPYPVDVSAELSAAKARVVAELREVPHASTWSARLWMCLLACSSPPGRWGPLGGWTLMLRTHAVLHHLRHALDLGHLVRILRGEAHDGPGGGLLHRDVGHFLHRAAHSSLSHFMAHHLPAGTVRAGSCPGLGGSGGALLGKGERPQE